jgi:UDP-N-acetylglucosamine 2-epimerase (non-hydrolysing)
MTIVGTRPEIIRLAAVLKKLDQYTNHVLVHTQQNFDYNLSEVFFKDLDLRRPDHLLNVKASNVHEQLGNIITQTGLVMEKERPDVVLVLGDTNSALSVINAKRLKIPIIHLEAGDRSFDPYVPEELNRKVVDHVADLNLAYTEHSRRNLLREGIHPRGIFVVGSPIREVYEMIEPKIEGSDILKKLNLTPKQFMVASLHREENVDRPGGLETIVDTFSGLIEKYGHPIICSTHPRTRRRLEQLNLLAKSHPKVIWHEPFGLLDFLKLQTNSLCVISDSGTIHEDSSVLNFPAVAIRKSTEKQESIDSGHCVIAGLKRETILSCVDLVINNPVNLDHLPMPEAYAARDVSTKVLKIILGMSKLVDEWVWGDPEKKYI